MAGCNRDAAGGYRERNRSRARGIRRHACRRRATGGDRDDTGHHRTPGRITPGRRSGRCGPTRRRRRTRLAESWARTTGRRQRDDYAGRPPVPPSRWAPPPMPRPRPDGRRLRGRSRTLAPITAVAAIAARRRSRLGPERAVPARHNPAPPPPRTATRPGFPARPGGPAGPAASAAAVAWILVGQGDRGRKGLDHRRRWPSAVGAGRGHQRHQVHRSPPRRALPRWRVGSDHRGGDRSLYASRRRPRRSSACRDPASSVLRKHSG